MCGIHGYINSNTPEVNSDDYIKDGFVAGMLRGVDSSGIAVIDTARTDFEVRRLPVPGNFFVEDKTFNKMLPDIRKSKAISIAHTRAATVGKVAEYTSHPFSFWDKESGREFVGVHNGTLNTWNTSSGAFRFSVDSEWALHLIFTKGLDAFKEFSGAYCFVWWDSETPDNLYIARNDQRPMHVAFTKKGGMAYASEAGMLAWLTERRKIELDGSIRELRPDKLYTFDLNNIKDVDIQELPKRVYATTTYSGAYYSQTNVQKVTDLLAKIKAKVVKEEDKQANALEGGANAVTPSGETKPLVTLAETEDARSLEVLGHKATFTPSHTDNHSEILYGTCTVQNDGAPWTCDAIMRRATAVQWRPEDTLEVTILGAILTASDSVLVVSKPRLTIVPQPKLEEVSTAVAH